jgi:hypothetical protein
VREPLCSLLASASALGLIACGSGAGARPAQQPTPAGATRASPVPFVGRPQSAVLRLAAGRSTSHFVITAVPKDPWDLRVSAPAAADVAVQAQKQDGELLYLLETTREPGVCTVTRGRSHCLLRFAIGANQARGRWTVTAAKRAGPAAAARIEVTFHRPGSE